MSDAQEPDPRIAVLISGRGSNLGSLIEAVTTGQLDLNICVVISNVADAPGLQIAEKAGIATAVINHQNFASREAFDQALSEQMSQYEVQWVVLAGFMRILSEAFVQYWRGKLVNIHPSLLPLYQGLNTHARVIESGDKQAGASVHFVTPQLDDGPVILQGVVDVEPDDTAGTLGKRVLETEHVIYPMALQWLTSGKVVFREGHCLFNGQTLNDPPKLYKGKLYVGQGENGI